MKKIEIGTEFPRHFQSLYPEEFSLFSHLETASSIPSVLFAITTWKENGRPNICFHAWSSFCGEPGSFHAVLGNLYQHTHTYANILRERCFGLSFLPLSAYAQLVETITHNEAECDEFAAGGFTVQQARCIHAPLIAEAFLSMECTLKQTIDLSGTAEARWSSARCAISGWRRHLRMDMRVMARMGSCSSSRRRRICKAARQTARRSPRSGSKKWTEQGRFCRIFI